MRILVLLGSLVLFFVVLALMVMFLQATARAVKAQRSPQMRRAVQPVVKNLAPNQERLYRGLIERHDAVIAAYHQFLLDVFAILERPALNDVNVEPTARFLDAYAHAADIRPEVCPVGDALDEYAQAVRTLDRAWMAADQHARRVGTGLLSETERKKVTQAIKCLTTARDTAATPAERQAGYKQAMTLLSGVIVLPKQAAASLEIESGHVLAIGPGATGCAPVSHEGYWSPTRVADDQYPS